MNTPAPEFYQSPLDLSRPGNPRTDTPRFVLLSHVASNTHVTLDYVLRGFRIGYATVGPMVPHTYHEGKGWRDRLLTDAQDYLRGVIG